MRARRTLEGIGRFAAIPGALVAQAAGDDPVRLGLSSAVVYLLLLFLFATAGTTLMRRSAWSGAGVRVLWRIVVVPTLLLAAVVASWTFDLFTNGRVAFQESILWSVLVAISVAALWFWVEARARRLHAGASRTQVAEKPQRPGVTAAPPKPSGPSKEGTAIFVSYRRAGTGDVTGRIFDRLTRDFPSSMIFKDVDSIPLGVDFREHIVRSVSRCRVLLAVIGRDWAGAGPGPDGTTLQDPADFVRIEIETALERGIPVVPVLVQGARIPPESDLPPSLRRLAYHQGIAVRPDPDFHPDMERLVRGLRDHL